MRTALKLVTVIVVGLLGPAPSAHAQTGVYEEVDPGLTDPAIVDTPTPPGTRGNHLVWVPSKTHRVNRLLVFLPTGGVNNIPKEFTKLGTEIQRLGYHAVFLAYRNEAPIAFNLPAGCGSSADPKDAPAGCAIDIRREILTGTPSSDLVTIDEPNGIYNRLSKLLTHLATTDNEEWSQFLDASGKLDWSRTVLTGSSLGAGQAAIIAAEHQVHRAVLLHGWTDAAHGWVTLGATGKDRYFTFIHARDNFFVRTCQAYKTLELTVDCPLAGFPGPVVPDDPNPALLDRRKPPYDGDQIHVFNQPPGSTMGTGDHNHQSTSRDAWVAKGPGGTGISPVTVNGWRSALGDSDADTVLDEVDNCKLVANTDQTDSDGNKTGDACGPTFAQGTVGGSVPATLALALGPAATFGAFMPGIARTYETSTTANVISTAGDAMLSSSDPGHLTNTTFSLPEPLQVSFSTAAWTGPVSNFAVTIAFKQPIKATDALRTGVYSRTLTFTLSTTTP